MIKFKFKLNGNKITKTKIYESNLSDLEVSILKEIKEDGKYVTKNMTDKEEDLALRNLRLLGAIKIIPDKKETHVFYDDITYNL